MSRVPPNRRRVLLPRLLMALVALLLVLTFVAGSLLPSFGPSSAPHGPLTCLAERQPYLHDITVRGELESANNVEVRCEVRTGDHEWIRILEVVPEGTYVKPGDFLVRLDSSALEDERTRHMILCEQSKAALAAAQSASANVQGATERYLQGEYALACQEARTALMVAKDRQRRAKEYLEASRKLEAKGYITPQQLQADEFALKAADTEAQQAEVRILVLENYTRRKKLKDLECALIVGKAKLDSAEYQRKLEIQRLAEIEDQIRKCVVRAPVAGEVVLAHIFQNGHAHMIEPGESTFERRVLVRLPDPRRMQVKAKIEEEKIAAVRPGLPVIIQLEAFPEAQLAGRVLKISEYPDPESFHGPATKLYEAVVRIDTPRDGLRPGLTADVRIGVQRLENQLQLPCQAVIRHGEKSYCLQVRGDRREAREVTVGPSNGKTVVIRGGLEEGETVILAAATHRDQVVLPELPPETPLRLPLAFADPKTRAGVE